MADVKRKYNVETTLTAQKVCQLIDDGKINDLPLIVKHDDILSNVIESIGSPSEISGSDNTAYASSVKIDNSRVLVCYQSSSPLYLYAVVLTISGDSVSVGTPLLINNISAGFINVNLIDSNKVIVTYYGASTSLYAVVLTISGTTITAGSNTQFSAAGSGYVSTVTLDATHVVVSYRNYNSSGYLYSIVLAISGTTITAGTNTQINAVSTMYISSSLLESGKVIVCYQNATTSNYLWSVVLAISGTTITAGTLTQINSLSTSNISVAKINSTKALVSYKNDGASGYLYSIVLSISDTTITHGTATAIDSVSSDYVNSALTGENQIMLVYNNTGQKAVIVTISDLSITAGSPVRISSASTAISLLCLLFNNKVFSGYRGGASSRINGLILTIGIATPAETRNGKVIGVSLDASGNVQLKGKCKALTGLTPGSNYYFDVNGLISTTATGTFLGVALSSTELSIPDYLIS